MKKRVSQHRWRTTRPGKPKKRRIQKGGNFSDRMKIGASMGTPLDEYWFRPRMCGIDSQTTVTVHSKVKRDAVTSAMLSQKTSHGAQPPRGISKSRSTPGRSSRRDLYQTTIWGKSVVWGHYNLTNSRTLNSLLFAYYLVISFFRCVSNWEPWHIFLLKKASTYCIFFQLMWAFWIYWSTFFFIAKQQNINPKDIFWSNHPNPKSTLMTHSILWIGSWQKSLHNPLYIQLT